MKKHINKNGAAACGTTSLHIENHLLDSDYFKERAKEGLNWYLCEKCNKISK